MIELTFEYYNKLADQIITISSLLGGFSIAIIANFLVQETKTRLTNTIMLASTLSACFFLISVFAMTKIIMMTTVRMTMIMIWVVIRAMVLTVL